MSTGKINYFQVTGKNWDRFTSSTDPQMRSSIRDSVHKLSTFSPYFDNKLSWMPNAYVYYDSYAIYTNDPIAVSHPEWILKDSKNNKLYIPWGCKDNTCPQYAGDISNPAFREYQITQINKYLKANNETEAGYSGLWLDDVNLEMRVGDNLGLPAMPKDNITGKPMTLANWKLYFSEFVELIKLGIPESAGIVHNSIWFVSGDSYVDRQIAAADIINIERGFGDSGIVGGLEGLFSLNNLFKFIDRVHSLGCSVCIDDYFLVDQLYSLTCYFLINNGHDYFNVNEQTPDTWPKKIIDLGTALGARERITSLWARSFSKGFVIINEPGAKTQTIFLPAGLTDINNNPAPSITLDAKQGAIFFKK